MDRREEKKQHSIDQKINNCDRNLQTNNFESWSSSALVIFIHLKSSKH